MKVNQLIAILSLGIVSAVQAQTLVDFGPNPPTPGPNDQSQLQVAGGPANPDGLNYYSNNNPRPGQIFTTGSNPSGYLLNSLYFATSGGGGNLPASGQAYTLDLYSVSGTSATLVASYVSQSDFTFFQYDWLEWTNLGLVLQPNTEYAYSFYGSQGWECLSSVTNDPSVYNSGEVALIPSGGGAMTLGANWEASFDIGLSAVSALTVSPIAVAPTGVFQGSGTPVTLSASAAGPGPIHFQWETDGGSGGALTNIPNATNLTLTVQTTGLRPGTYNFDLVAANSSSAVTNSALFTILAAGVPNLILGVNPAYGWLTNGTVLEAINLGPTSGSEGAGILAEPVTVNGINFGTTPALTSWNAGTWSWWPPAFPINMSDANQTNMYGKGMDIASWATSAAQIIIPGSSLQTGHVYQLEVMMSGSWSWAAININSTPDTNFDAQQYSYFGSAADQTNLTAYLYTWKDTTGGTAEVNMSDASGTQEVFVWGYALSDVTSTVNLPVAISHPSMLAGGNFKFTLNSTPDTVINVQASTNLVNWVNSATVINFSGLDTYTNAAPVNSAPVQFFRLQGQ